MISYLNTSFFILPLIPALARKAYNEPEEFRKAKQECRMWLRGLFTSRSGQQEGRGATRRGQRRSDDDDESRDRLMSDANELQDAAGGTNYHSTSSTLSQISLLETLKLSAKFSLLWFADCYFLLACLEYTTVASSTILTSTSSIFTMMFAVITGVESFTIRKLAGVLTSLTGVILISVVDYTGQSSDEEHRGDFPEKSTGELALGNTLALLSAILYGVYTVFMKRSFPDENKINMPIFFGFIGLINVLCLWPGFFVLHYTGFETFELPTEGQIILILLLNALGSMLADIFCAYAVLMTSPILVTVGLSLEIPLSLVGQIVLNSQTSTWLYWIGAIVVACSFIIVN